MKIVDYDVLGCEANDDGWELRKAVLARMLEGWQPLGGVSVSFSPGRGYSEDTRTQWAQAMVKYEESGR